MAKTYKLPPRLIDIHNHPSFDDDGSKFLAQMDRLHIETMLLMGWPGQEGSNQMALDCARRFPGRYIACCFLEPRDGKKALREMRRWHGEGVRIVKLFPNYGYYPDDFLHDQPHAETVFPVFSLQSDPLPRPSAQRD